MYNEPETTITIVFTKMLMGVFFEFYKGQPFSTYATFYENFYPLIPTQKY